ncbi:MAG: ATP-binding cassette domain-containing protein [candidate division Zixibacteria bacterium]|nr:ATP-binding cassette domain-containing protein [candidate division Zixibacteria bacterium]
MIENDLLVNLEGIRFGYPKTSGGFEIFVEDLKVKKGEICYLFGPSGCGKTTILNIIAGFLRPSTGVVTLKESPIGGRFLSYVMQRVTLLPWLNIRKNIQREAFYRNVTVSEEEIYRLANIAELTKIDLEKKPFELSGGMLNRTVLIRALSINPNLLLLDEAFHSIDFNRRKNIMREIFNKVDNQELGVIGSTHQPYEIMMAADRVIVLSGDMPFGENEIIINTPRKNRDGKWYQGSEVKKIQESLGWII